jgi:adenosine deaminase
MQTALTDFIAGLPKCELHLHIEGTLTPDMRKRLGVRNKIVPAGRSFDALEVETAGTETKQTGFDQYKMFLALYFEGLKVLRTEQDFHDIAFDYLKSCHDNNIRYAEISFDPQAHTSRDIPFAVVMDGLVSGSRAGRDAFGVESNLIMCINRDLPADDALAMLKDAKPYRDQILGLGLDSVEDGHPPVKFKQAYDLARDQGYRLTAHCDVDMPDAVQNIGQCIDILKVERIDHGINAIEDQRLIDAVIAQNICLTACPTWRTGDPAPRRVDRIRKMLDMGLKVTLNTDDPGYFISGPMNNMLPPVAALGHFTKAELSQFMINAFDAAWLPRESRDSYIAEVKDYLATSLA